MAYCMIWLVNTHGNKQNTVTLKVSIILLPDQGIANVQGSKHAVKPTSNLKTGEYFTHL